MAKGITTTITSAAARFLTSQTSTPRVDSGGASAPPVPNQSADLASPRESSPESVPRSQHKVKREFVLTHETDAMLTELVHVLRDKTAARLSGSYVLRGLARLMMNHLPAIRTAAVAYGPRRLPATSPRHAPARMEFEKYLATVFELALTGRLPPSPEQVSPTPSESADTEPRDPDFAS